MGKKLTPHGFTLIELLIVMAIIGLLIAIALPQFSRYRAAANNAAALSDLRNFRSEMEASHSLYQVYPAL